MGPRLMGPEEAAGRKTTLACWCRSPDVSAAHSWVLPMAHMGKPRHRAACVPPELPVCGTQAQFITPAANLSITCSQLRVILGCILGVRGHPRATLF